GIILGSVIAWFGAVGLWTIPAFLLLRKHRLGLIDRAHLSFPGIPITSHKTDFTSLIDNNFSRN
mgnify:CR=1